MSSAGKSFITAGLCRIFSNDGYETVPFKSQNMALNSYITADGNEMGRAQVMQAQASRKLPDVRMNPILLKPNSEKGSQIILNGKVYSQMNAKEYYRKKGEFIPHIKNAYSSLSSENDIIVLEGAGSPAEINLKDVDIVNMGMAKISDSPVILVADIDRGGVFASVYGTIMLLEEEERKRIKGIIINKFRGDKSILESGLTQIENLTGVPVLGVVPYAEIDLDDEDSLSERLLCNKQKENSTIDIAVIRLPRISNFTDFNIFERFDDVSIRYVSSVAELKNPDMLIIPGTKNTISDLEWLRKNGLESKIMQYHEKGKLIFGICGGYQMLGNTIYYTEDDNFSQKINKQIRGMGLLDVETVNQEEKTTYQQKYTIENLNGDFSILSGTQINGYEIHMGVTAENKTGDLTTQFTFDKFGFSKGCCNNEENVFGTYIHGFFDDIADKIIAVLKKQKGIDGNTEAFDLESYKDSQYEKLDKLLRDNIDIQKIYEILENN
jgi:adenosylcobyric acid synthase